MSAELLCSSLTMTSEAELFPPSLAIERLVPGRRLLRFLIFDLGLTSNDGAGEGLLPELGALYRLEGPMWQTILINDL